MKTPIAPFLLKRQANLFDAKEYLFKAFIAVCIAYFVGKNNTYLSKDMISILFGMFLTLEPVNHSGLRNGLKQLEASIIGAIITGIIISIFGLNLLTTAIAITATLYVSLLINWREVSVVAIFTSIYMTQYVQFTLDGQPSQWLTFLLRISALLVGVSIALIVNFIFSQFGYRHIYEKRLLHVVEELNKSIELFMNQLTHMHTENIPELMTRFPNLFNTLDWIFAMIKDSQKDILKNKNKTHQQRLQYAENVALSLRDIIHLYYDLMFQIKNGAKEYHTPKAILELKHIQEQLINFETKLENRIHTQTSTKTDILNHEMSELKSIQTLTIAINDLLKL